MSGSRQTGGIRRPKQQRRNLVWSGRASDASATSGYLAHAVSNGIGLPAGAGQGVGSAWHVGLRLHRVSRRGHMSAGVRSKGSKREPAALTDHELRTIRDRLDATPVSASAGETSRGFLRQECWSRPPDVRLAAPRVAIGHGEPAGQSHRWQALAWGLSTLA